MSKPVLGCFLLGATPLGLLARGAEIDNETHVIPEQNSSETQ